MCGHFLSVLRRAAIGKVSGNAGSRMAWLGLLKL